MASFKKLISSLISTRLLEKTQKKKTKENTEQEDALLPLETTQSSIQIIFPSSSMEVNIPDERTLEKVRKAGKQRAYSLYVYGSGYLHPLHKKSDLQFTIVDFLGKQKNGPYLYEIAWTPVKLTIKQYEQGHYNFSMALPPQLVYEESIWKVIVSWPNSVIASKSAHPAFVN